MVMQYNFDSIKNLRVSRNMTQAEFGRFVGMSRQDVRAWERGHVPTVRNLIKIAQACGSASLDIFFHITHHYGNINNDLSHASYDTRGGPQ
jgi:transcriptional regulator with XRE-family HTH domain